MRKLVNESIKDVLKPKSTNEIKYAIDKIKNEFTFRVGDLKKLLQKYPDDLPVGTIGHYG
jgi:hypothetical protein